MHSKKPTSLPTKVRIDAKIINLATHLGVPNFTEYKNQERLKALGVLVLSYATKPDISYNMCKLLGKLIRV